MSWGGFEFDAEAFDIVFGREQSYDLYVASVAGA
jgi:hypothetical protein